MKKLLISMMMIILLMSFGTFTYATDTKDADTNEKDTQNSETQEQETQAEELKADIKLTTNVSVEQSNKNVELILSVGEIKGDISDLIQCGIEANLEYSNEIIDDVQTTKLDTKNVANITCANKKLLIEMTGINANTDLIKLTLTLKENLETDTTIFKLTDIVFTKNGEGNQESSQVKNSTLTANITIEKKEETPREEEKNDEIQNDETKDVFESEDTKEEQQNVPTQEHQNSAETSKTEDKTTAKNTLPKAGEKTITLMIISLVIIIGIVCFARYKNIEIK